MPQIKAISFCADNTKPNQKPNEDFFVVSYNEKIAAVADGATRSYIQGKYPECSALIAATTFCKWVVYQFMLGKSFNEAFEYANNEIAEQNRIFGITPQTCDYLNNDYFSCSGVAGMFSKENPHLFTYGSIGDCRVLIYDKGCSPVHVSEDPLGTLEKFRDNAGFDDTSRHLFWRKMLRNNPHQRHMTYGALTGEPEAMSYLKMGRIYLQDGDTIVLCTDGISPFLCNYVFRALIRDSFGQAYAAIEEHMKDLLTWMTPQLAAQGIQNLDDDKAFVAFSFSA